MGRLWVAALVLPALACGGGGDIRIARPDGGEAAEPRPDSAPGVDAPADASAAPEATPAADAGGERADGGGGAPAMDGGGAPAMDGGGAAKDPDWPPDEPLPAAFDFPPWVNMPAPHRIVISWRTVAATTGRVQFGPWPLLGQTRGTPAAANLHHVDLGVLQPATAYAYEVVVDGTPAVRRGVFVTPGRAAWRFVHFGEVHTPSKAAAVARSAATLRAFRPHVLVESGDMVDVGDDLDHWRSYLRTAAPWISNVIILPVGSNHVQGPGGNSNLRELFVLPENERWYPTRYGQVQFLTIDSTASSNSDIGSKTPLWIAEQTRLAHDGVDDPDFLVAAWHYPACSSQYASRASTRAWIQDHFVRPFRENGGVDLILVGHDKYYERSLIKGGIVHLQTNVGSLSPSTPGNDHPDCTPVKTRRDTLSVALFDVSPLRLDARVLDDAGRDVDSFSISRP